MLSGRSSVSRAPNRLSLLLDRLREQGQRLVDLTSSNPTRAALPYPAADILEALQQPQSLDYEPEPFGLLAGRQAVAQLWQEQGLRVSPSRILLTASSSDAYSYLLKLLCDPGDEILIPQPGYPLFEHLARLEGVRLVSYRLHYDGAWAIDLDQLRCAVGPRTRAVVVVNPNNPTGNYLKRAELQSLAELGLPLLSDEVFASYPLCADARRAATALEADGTLVFCLGGLSKLAALPQLKLSWVTASGPQSLLGEALARLELIVDTYLSVGSAVQLALPRLLALRRDVHTAIRARCQHNLHEAQRQCSGSVLSALYTEGGWYVVLRLPRLLTEEAWVLELLEQDGVLVQPGWFYDFADEPYAVLSLLTVEDSFREGLSRIVARAERLA
jgi:alanine-synthesizing transaminase